VKISDSQFVAVAKRHVLRRRSATTARRETTSVAKDAGRSSRTRTTARRTCRPLLTTDLSLRFDPIYEPISRRFKDNPAEFADAFRRTWRKLTHRDIGPVVRHLGSEVLTNELIWQDPLQAVDLSTDAAACCKRRARGLVQPDRSACGQRVRRGVAQ
jgi:catalase (peroxidase I)